MFQYQFILTGRNLHNVFHVSCLIPFSFCYYQSLQYLSLSLINFLSLIYFSSLMNGLFQHMNGVVVSVVTGVFHVIWHSTLAFIYWTEHAKFSQAAGAFDMWDSKHLGRRRHFHTAIGDAKGVIFHILKAWCLGEKCVLFHFFFYLFHFLTVMQP